jgi:uncharacterized protein (DUF1015 family)
MLYPFNAAYYSLKHRPRIGDLTVSDLDTAEHLWGGPDHSKAFRNLLVGQPETRSETWQAWISAGEFELTDQPFFYVLHQVQEVDDKRVDRWGLYAAIDVSVPKLYTHEDVLAEGVERARQGLEACEADLAPIFVGCEESLGGELRELLRFACHKQKPIMTLDDSKYGLHSVWNITEAGIEERIKTFFESAPLFLLDGHHRLAAARENQRLGLGDGKILVCVCSMAQTDTLILPIHRAVSYERWMLPDVMEGDLVRAGCRISEVDELRVNTIGKFLETYHSLEPFCVLLHSHQERPRLVHLPRAQKETNELKMLPVACLDFAVLAQHAQATAIPVANLAQLLDQLALDQAQVGFFLPAASPAQVRAIALARSRMPRKSTRFAPKPALGLICRPWNSSG